MPQDFFAPGLPTQYEDTRKSTLPQNPKARAAAMRAWEQEGARPSMQGMYDDEPSVDELLASAQGTLNDTYANANNVRNAGLMADNPADRAAANEQDRTVSSGRKDVADSMLGSLSFAPGPVGVGARAGLGMMGLYDAVTGETTGDRVMGGVQALTPMFDIVPAISAARKAVPAGMPSRVWGGASQGEEVAGSAFANKQSHSIPPVQHYWDALDQGVDPAKAVKIAGGRDKQSVAALRSLQNAGKEARSAPWEDLTGQVDSMVDPLANARSRASERFGGKVYRSETGNPAGPARSVPTPEAGMGEGEPIVTPDGIFSSSGKWLAPLAGSADDIAFATMRNSRDPRR
jgi:hypothetical protein